MRNQIFKQFKSVGFQFVSFKSFGKNKCLEYKYYPKYFKDKHYTLIIFLSRLQFMDYSDKYDITDIEFRLYIHSNKNDLLNSLCQLPDSTDYYKNLLNELINTYFKNEIREQKFKKILK